MTRLRDIMPKGFYARSVLILFMPILALLLGITWYYYDDHLRGVNERLSEAVARDIALVAMVHDREPELIAGRRDLISDVQTFQLDIEAICPAGEDRAAITRAYPSVPGALSREIDRDFTLNYAGENRDISICLMSAGEALTFTVPRKRTVILNGHIFIVWVLMFGLLLIVTALGFLRNQVRSILRLGEAARAYGRGRDVPDFKPSGATEVREAARAVIDMRDRIQAAADQRTAMLAAVSHDLRTPLTRLKLQLAMVDQTEDIRDARRDLDEMAMMLDEYLAFARGEEGETSEPTRIDTLLAETVARLPEGAERVTLKAMPETVLTVRPMAVRRAVSNLVSNALSHAQAVDVTLINGPRAIEVLVDDDGPGIPVEQREEAFRPFARLDPSRNLNTSGVGLGLALARDVARSHGGEIRLETSPQGGLRARLRLPL